MADSMSSDDEQDYYSDQDSLQGIQNDDEDDCDWPSPNVPSCQVITKELLLAAQREDLHRVIDLLTLSEQHAQTLLIHHCWDVERLLAVLVEKRRDRLFSDTSIMVVEQQGLSSSQSSSSITCNICIEDVFPDAVTTMDCGHCFCNDCENSPSYLLYLQP